MIRVTITEPYNVATLLVESDEVVVDAVFEAWLDSDDCGHWTAYDVRDRCAEDTKSDRARGHFGEWFYEFFFGLEDPHEVFADGFPEAVEKRIDGMKDAFTDAVFESLDVAEDYEQTLRGLPR